MEHAYAVENHMVEQYLLSELAPGARDEFEAHFFDCQECAAELKVTDAFMRAARSELRVPEASTASPAARPHIVSQSSRKILKWRPAFAITALAACLLLVAYQNIVTLPHLRNDVAVMNAPAVLPTISLVGSNSRGGAIPSVALNGAKAVLLQVDIPSQEQFSSYECALYTPQHRLIWTVRVSPEQARETVSIRVPLASNASGTYLLEVQGHRTQSDASATSGTVLATYPVTLNAGSAGSGQ
jgi:hypothetical protein